MVNTLVRVEHFHIDSLRDDILDQHWSLAREPGHNQFRWQLPELDHQFSDRHAAASVELTSNCSLSLTTSSG